MRKLRALFLRVIGLFNWQRRDRELDDELESNLQMQIEDNLQRGMSPDEARYAALRKFGNVTLVKEEARELWSFVWLEQLWQDVRFGVRMLAKNPGFTAVAVLTLALGIGATTAIFSVVDAVLLQGSPYKNPAQLVGLSAKSPQGEAVPVSAGDFNEWHRESQAFEGLAAYNMWEFRVLSGMGDPDEVWTSPISAGVFHLLGINAIIGRT